MMAAFRNAVDQQLTGAHSGPPKRINVTVCRGQTSSLRLSRMTIDEKFMAHARECVRLAGLTDDQEVRHQLIALARDWIVIARKQEEEDDDSKVLVFPSAVERNRRHGLRISLRHAGPRRLS